MNRSPFLCPFLYAASPPGPCVKRHFWKFWVGNCARCGKIVKEGAGVFCGNFLHGRGSFPPCQKVWCGTCYSVPLGSPYPIRRPVDEDGFENLALGDRDRFVVARNGDPLITPFQCDVCHFRNLQGRDPHGHIEEDRRLLSDIRHANINAFWSREPSTVSSNLSHAKRMEAIGSWYGLTSVSPQMGPFPLRDTFGMAAAVVMLKRSLDPGRWEKYIQFSTARRIRSAFSNVYHSSAMLEEVVTMAYETSKLFETNCPTYGYWFERFILGCHKRMGDYVVTDFALSKILFYELMVQLEFDWKSTRDADLLLDIEKFSLILISGFLCGLRGEEIMKVDISGLMKYIDVGAADREHPHAVIPLLGRLKGETGDRYHYMIVARVTSGGLAVGRWLDRLVASLLKRGRTNGFLFVDGKGVQRKVGTYNDEFWDRLQRVRMAKPFLFEPKVKIKNAYGLRRSLRRGSNSEATNNGVSNAPSRSKLVQTTLIKNPTTTWLEKIKISFNRI